MRSGGKVTVDRDGHPIEIPLWYRVIRASRHLGVAPWDLYDQPVWWLNAAEAAMDVEAAAGDGAAKPVGGKSGADGRRARDPARRPG